MDVEKIHKRYQTNDRGFGVVAGGEVSHGQLVKYVR